jgi:hypothetical protein
MGRRKPLTVKDGPLAGEVFELDLEFDEEARLRTSEGKVAVYRASPDLDYVDSTGHHLHCLRFVAMDPSE